MGRRALVPRALVRAFCIAACVAACVAPAAATLGARASRPHDPGSLAVADSLYWAGDAARSLSVLEEHLRATPDDYDALWKAARAAVSVGLLEDDRAVRREVYTVGVTHGEAAVRLRPEGVDGLYWLANSVGLRSFLLSPWKAASEGQRVYDLSNRVLALDPAHAGAHHTLGKLALRVMQFSRVERFVARVVLGNDALRNASWEMAESHLARAAELDPTSIVAHFDLGILHQSRHRLDRAEAEFERAVALPPRHPGDRAYRADAENLLKRVRVELGR